MWNPIDILDQDRFVLTPDPHPLLQTMSLCVSTENHEKAGQNCHLSVLVVGVGLFPVSLHRNAVESLFPHPVRWSSPQSTSTPVDFTHLLPLLFVIHVRPPVNVRTPRRGYGRLREKYKGVLYSRLDLFDRGSLYLNDILVHLDSFLSYENITVDTVSRVWGRSPRCIDRSNRLFISDD